MDRFEFDDVELTYQQHERGERVVLVHASAFVSWYRPLIEHLTGFSTLSYRRRIKADGHGAYRMLTVAEDAAICARLMDHVGWPTAHIVGHSYGGLVALQLAISNSERVGSLALLEPAARGISSSAAITAALEPVVAAYKSGDTSGAVDGFLRHVCGDGYRTALERAIPGAFGEALDEADLFFQAEMPAVQRWAFGAGDAAQIEHPVLNVLGADSAQRFVEGSELIEAWLPQAERLTVPDAGHLLMIQNPTALAKGLSDFFTRHAIGSTERSDAAMG